MLHLDSLLLVHSAEGAAFLNVAGTFGMVANYVAAVISISSMGAPRPANPFDELEWARLAA